MGFPWSVFSNCIRRHHASSVVSREPRPTITGIAQEAEKNMKQQHHDDQQRIVESGGLVFRMKMVGIEKYSAKSLDKNGSYEVIFNDVLKRRLHKRKNKPTVELCLTPTRIQLLRREPWKIFFDHDLEYVEHYDWDGRLLAYFISEPCDESILCFYLHSPKCSTAITGQRICKAMSYVKSLLPPSENEWLTVSIIGQESSGIQLKRPSTQTPAADGTEMNGVRSVCADPTLQQDGVPPSRPHDVAKMGEAEKREDASEHHNSINETSNNEQLQTKPSSGGDMGLFLFIPPKPDKFHPPDEALWNVHKSVKHVFDPDEMATDWQPRTGSDEDQAEDIQERCTEVVESGCSSGMHAFSIEQAEPLSQGLSGGPKVIQPSEMQVDKPGSLLRAASDGIFSYFLV